MDIPNQLDRYHLVILHSHGKSLINGGCNGKTIYKWAIFHGYVSHNQRIETNLFCFLLQMENHQPTSYQRLTLWNGGRILVGLYLAVLAMFSFLMTTG